MNHIIVWYTTISILIYQEIYKNAQIQNGYICNTKEENSTNSYRSNLNLFWRVLYRQFW